MDCGIIGSFPQLSAWRIEQFHRREPWIDQATLGTVSSVWGPKWHKAVVNGDAIRETAPPGHAFGAWTCPGVHSGIDSLGLLAEFWDTPETEVQTGVRPNWSLGLVRNHALCAHIATEQRLERQDARRQSSVSEKGQAPWRITAPGGWAQTVCGMSSCGLPQVLFRSSLLFLHCSFLGCSWSWTGRCWPCWASSRRFFFPCCPSSKKCPSPPNNLS